MSVLRVFTSRSVVEMLFQVTHGAVKGAVEIPASKSHTVRAVFFAGLAQGESVIEAPLESRDTLAAVNCARTFGASVKTESGAWIVRGVGTPPPVPENVIDVANSGTTLYIGLGVASLCDGYSVFTGDEQIRRRPVEPLLASLRDLGAEAFATKSNACPPAVIRGPLKGGQTTIKVLTSQYVTSLLIAGACAQKPVEIFVENVLEQPYIEMTLAWLDSQGVQYEKENLSHFRFEGGARFKPFKRRMPGDFSSATFFLAAGAIAGGPVVLRGLDMRDTQGDKAVVDYLRAMGARIELTPDGLAVSTGDLKGVQLDLNATPDALPAMAVVACFARGTTRLVNVPQARLKETDRISVMAAELSKMGARVRELPDGLEVEGAGLVGTTVRGHGDHRVVMALAVAALAAKGTTTISEAEAVDVTFPNFAQLMKNIGARLEEKN